MMVEFRVMGVHGKLTLEQGTVTYSGLFGLGGKWWELRNQLHHDSPCRFGEDYNRYLPVVKHSLTVKLHNFLGTALAECISFNSCPCISEVTTKIPDKPINYQYTTMDKWITTDISLSMTST
jgi:hypothetical protein